MSSKSKPPGEILVGVRDEGDGPTRSDKRAPSAEAGSRGRGSERSAGSGGERAGNRDVRGARRDDSSRDVRTDTPPPLPPNCPRERLPKSILPDRGRVKPRATVRYVPLFKYGPYEEESTTEAQIEVGVAYYRGEWRDFDCVEFKDGVHYLRIRLTKRGRSSPEALYGWATFEAYDQIGKTVPEKDYYLSQFYVERKPTVLISLFDGIGGGRVAMEDLQAQYSIVRSFSSENNKAAKAVVKRNFPDTVDLGGVDNIDRRVIERRILGDAEVERVRRCATWDDEVHFVVITGPPCQNLSQAKAVNGMTEGVLDGEKSRMFFHVPRIVKHLTDILAQKVRGPFHKKKIVHYMVENVEMSNRDKMIFSEFLGGANPWKIDLNEGGCCASLMSRRRLYWCSTMPSGREVGIDDFKRLRCAHPALAEGKELDDVLAQHGYEGYEFCNKKTGRRVERLPTMTRFIENKGQENYYIRLCCGRGKEGNSRDEPLIRAPEDVNEDLLGFPVGHTQYGVGDKKHSEEDRRRLLGNTFMVFHIKYLLKRMHVFTDLVTHEKHEVASVPMLPQELCRLQIQSETVTKPKKYQNILSVLLEKLHFDDLEKGRQGPILEYFNDKPNGCEMQKALV